MLFYSCPNLASSPITNAHFSGCNFPVGNSDSDVGCCTPGTFVLLLSFGCIRESCLDRKDLLGSHLIGTDLPLTSDPHGVRSVSLAPPADYVGYTHTT